MTKKQKLIKEACQPCNTAVLGIVTHSQSAIEELEAIREMEITGAKEKIMQGKFPFTKDELEIRVKDHKHWIQKNWDRYTNCCEIGYLEDV